MTPKVGWIRSEDPGTASRSPRPSTPDDRSPQHGRDDDAPDEIDAGATAAARDPDQTTG